MFCHKNKNQSVFIPARLIFRETPEPGPRSGPKPGPKAGPKPGPKPAPTPAPPSAGARSGSKPAPRPAPKPAPPKAPAQPLKSPSVPLETLKARLRTAGLDERRKLSLEILSTAQANHDQPSANFARAEIERYCTDKKAEINKEYDQLVTEAQSEQNAQRKAIRIERLRTAREEELRPYNNPNEFLASRLALNNFETLPEDERAILLEASSFQETAISKYRVAQDKTDDPDLYLDDDKVTDIRGTSSESLTEEYATARYTAAETDEEDEDHNPDVAFYNEELRVIADSHHGFPNSRILNRQVAIEFLKGRGNQLHPIIRARIYIDIANSLLYELTRDRDLELAKKFLLKGIALLEEFRNSNPQNFEDLSPFKDYQTIDTTLGYAYYRYAALLQEQTKKSGKPDETVCQWYEKALDKALWSGTRTWLNDYIDYLLQFPNTLDRATEVIIKHYDKENPGSTSDAVAMVLERLRIKVDDSRNFGEFTESSRKYRSLLKKYALESNWNWREDPSYFNNHGKYYEIVEKWYSPSSTKEQREKLFRDLFSGPNGQDMANRYKSSPVTAAHYKLIVEATKEADPPENIHYWYWLERRAEKIAKLTNLPQTKLDLLYAHLLDDWAPNGKVDRKKALEFYKKALANRKELDSTEVADAIARCYRILNAPQSYGAGEYFWAATDIGERPTPTWENEEDEKKFEIEDPTDNLVVLFYDKEQNIGVVINRYINVAAFSTAYNKGDYLKKIAKRKQLKKERERLQQESKPTTEIDGRIAKLVEEILKLEKTLTPEGIGDIYYFRIGPKGIQIHFDTVYHVRQKEQEHQEYLEDPKLARAVNAHDFPFAGFSAATMGLYRDFTNFSGRRKPRENGWVPITDDDGNYLFLDDKNNIVQANPDIYDNR